MSTQLQETPEHIASVENIPEPKQLNDLEVQILFKWFTGECLGMPIQALLISQDNYGCLTGERIQELKEFMIKHGAVTYINIIGTNQITNDEVYTISTEAE